MDNHTEGRLAILPSHCSHGRWIHVAFQDIGNCWQQQTRFGNSFFLYKISVSVTFHAIETQYYIRK